MNGLSPSLSEGGRPFWHDSRQFLLGNPQPPATLDLRLSLNPGGTMPRVQYDRRDPDLVRLRRVSAKARRTRESLDVMYGERADLIFALRHKGLPWSAMAQACDVTEQAIVNVYRDEVGRRGAAIAREAEAAAAVNS